MQKITVIIICSLLFAACNATTTLSQKAKVKSSSSIATQLEQEFLRQVNNARSESRTCGAKKFLPAPALVLDARLTKAAYAHSLDMSKEQFLEHVSSNGDTLVERMNDVNYTWNAVGENLAHNQKTIKQVIDDWLASPGHCSNLMSSDYNQTGIAVIDWYWTQVYASPK